MIRGVLVDLSGVLYVGDRALPGAIEALARLKQAGIPHRFVTNVSRQPATRILSSLSKFGFDISAADLFTAPQAARAYIEAHKLRPHLLVHPDIIEEFSGITTEKPNAVLLGDAEAGFNYQNLNKSFQLLVDGAEFLALGDNRYFMESGGLNLDIGPFVRALEFASGSSAMILGKPATEFFITAVESLSCSNQQVVMVGDDVLTDVNGALAADLQAILVKTGKYRTGDEHQICRDGAVVLSDLRAAVDWILDNAE